jgi:DNA-binding SARP family transcriptional activator/tetratricopeptide (TPR) repeat protein
LRRPGSELDEGGLYSIGSPLDAILPGARRVLEETDGGVVEFRILGPVEVVDDCGTRLPLAPRETRIATVLLLSANQVVPSSQIVDAVFGDDPPVTAVRQIHNGVWRLRKHLAIEAVPPGYLLRLRDGHIDAHRFGDFLARARELQASGDLEGALDATRAALRLWRGPALAGLGGPTLVAAATRLDEQRLSAVELSTELTLGLGRHDEIVSELAALVASYPLRERLVRYLMLALHRGGRQAEALDAYERLRVRLAGELGLDPSLETRDLHTAILRDDVQSTMDAPAVRAPRPRQLPTPLRHFVGRAAELKELTAAIRPTAEANSPVPIAAVSGPAGVGKTALAVTWAHQAAPDFPDGQLYVDLRGQNPGGSPVEPAVAARGFLWALGVPPRQIPGSLTELAALLRSTLAGRHILMVLDNAHDVDQVRPLLPGTGTCAVIVTSRSQLIGLLVAEAAVPITLDVFGPVESRDLFERHLGPQRVADEPGAVSDITARCAHLPLALAIVAARAARHSTFPLSAFAAELSDARQRLDVLDGGHSTAQVRAAFSWSYDRLSRDAARLFRLTGAHAGPDVSVAAAASLAGVSTARALQLLAELTDIRLLVEHVPRRYTSHDLLRAYAVELALAHDSEEDRRAATLRMVDHYLGTAHAGSTSIDRNRLPLAIDPAQPGTTAESFASTAAAMAWFEAEHDVLTSVIHRAAELGLDRKVWHLVWTLSPYLNRRGHWHAWESLCHMGIVAAERGGTVIDQARAHRGLSTVHLRLGRLAEARDELRRTLQLCHGVDGAEAHASHAEIGMSETYFMDNDYGTALQHLERALALASVAGAAGAAAARGDVLNNLGCCHTMLGHHEQALRYFEEAVALFQEIEDPHGEAAAWNGVGSTLSALGRYEEAVPNLRRAVEMFAALGDRYIESQCLVDLGDTHRAADNLDHAGQAWRAALAILVDLQHRDAEGVRTRLAEVGRSVT